MKNLKKILLIGTCIVLALLLVGVALYFVSWTTDVEINNCYEIFPNGITGVPIDVKLHLRRHDYLFRPSKYEILAYEAAEYVQFAFALPEGCRSVSQNDDPSFVVVPGYYLDTQNIEANAIYFAISMEKGLFVTRLGNSTFLLVGSADENYKYIEIVNYFSDFIDNGCQPW